ncbi:potassium channel family protein [Stieleria varia]|nr:potassium channel protein [Stieleria varia]
MHSSLAKLRNGFTALVAIVVLATMGFKWIAGYGWLESLWMVVVTISTVGYSERSSASDATQILSIAVIVLGVSAAAYTFTGVIQTMLQGELDRAIGRRRMEKEIKRLSNHTIVCGFGKSGPILAQYLSSQKRQFVILEIDEDQFQQAIQLGYHAINADATDEDVLISVGIQRASSIVVALPTDAQNVFITLSARNLCPKVRIVAQAERESSSRKLRQAGADEVVMGHQMVAEYMSRLVTRPSTAHFFLSLTQSATEDFLLDELYVPDGSSVIGKTIAQLRVRDLYELLVVGIKLADDSFVFNPAGSREFAANETILVMGKQADVDHFRDKNSLLEPGIHPGCEP